MNDRIKALVLMITVIAVVIGLAELTEAYPNVTVSIIIVVFLVVLYQFCYTIVKHR